MRRGLARHGLRVRPVRATSKTDEYNKLMTERMKWADNPFEYDFQRGLYYHRVLEGKAKLLCGTQATSREDISYLKQAEGVDVVISVRFRLYPAMLACPWQKYAYAGVAPGACVLFC
jgi:hypothetical protein